MAGIRQLEKLKTHLFTKDKMTKKQTVNIRLEIWWLNCFYEIFVKGSMAGILLYFSTKNPPHRQAKYRYA